MAEEHVVIVQFTEGGELDGRRPWAFRSRRHRRRIADLIRH
jgi:hypothetical protein